MHLGKVVPGRMQAKGVSRCVRGKATEGCSEEGRSEICLLFDLRRDVRAYWARDGMDAAKLEQGE